MDKVETVTLDELIASLQQAREEHGGDAKVLFASSYGDRARTMQAHRLRGEVQAVALRDSAYSDSGVALADDDGSDDYYDAVHDGDVTYLRIK